MTWSSSCAQRSSPADGIEARNRGASEGFRLDVGAANNACVGLIAQSVEQWIFNPTVQGSNPCRPTPRHHAAKRWQPASWLGSLRALGFSRATHIL